MTYIDDLQKQKDDIKNQDAMLLPVHYARKDLEGHPNKIKKGNRLVMMIYFNDVECVFVFDKFGNGGYCYLKDIETKKEN